MQRIAQKGLERRTPDRVDADAQRTDGAAVVALPTCDEARPTGLTGIEVVLTSELQRAIHRLGAAGPGEHPIETAGRQSGELIGEPLGRIGGEVRVVTEGKASGLLADGIDDPDLAVP